MTYLLYRELGFGYPQKKFSENDQLEGGGDPDHRGGNACSHRANRFRHHGGALRHFRQVLPLLRARADVVEDPVRADQAAGVPDMTGKTTMIGKETPGGESLEKQVTALRERFRGAPPEAVLAWALEAHHPDIALASSFSMED